MKSVFFMLIFLMTQALATGQRDHFFRQFTQRDGLSNNSVNDLLADEDGYIWIATDDGLNRFDGHRFVTFRHDRHDKNTPAGNHFSAICADHEGRIWCGGVGWPAVTYHDRATGTFHHLPLSDDPNKLFVIADIFCDQQGFIWISTANNLFRIDPSAMQVKDVCQSADENERPRNCRIFYGDVFADDPTGKGFWLTTSGGIHFYNFEKQSFDHAGFEQKYSKIAAFKDCRTLTTDNDGLLWSGTQMGTDHWFWFGYDPQLDSIVHLTDDVHLDDHLQKNNFSSLHRSPNNEIWLGNNARTPLIWNTRSRTFDYSLVRQYPGSLKNHTLNAALFDNKGNTWVGTEDGLFAEYADYTKAEVNWIGDYAEFQTPRIKCLYELTPDDLLIAANKQVWHWNRQKHRTEVIPVIIHGDTLKEDVRYIGFKNDHEVWVATFFGLYSMHLTTGKFSTELEQMPEDWQKLLKINSYIQHVFSDREGYTYICTDSGIYIFHHAKKFYRRIKEYVGSASLKMRIVSYAKRKAGGYWWVDDRNGNIMYLEHPEGELKLATFNQNMPVSPTSICEDDKQRIWVGSVSMGMALWQPETNTWTQYGIESGLHSNCIYRILQAKSGNILTITSTGIDQFDEQHDRFRRLFSEYTLPYYMHRNVGLIASDGRLWSYSQNIFYSIKPDEFETTTNDKKVLLNSVLVNGTSTFWKANGEVYHLKADENNLLISFSALNLNPNSDTQYEYRITGQHENWVNTHDESQLYFTNLPPGDYVLELRSDYGTGIFSDNTTALQFVIHPPWYKTWWSYSLMVFISVALIFYTSRRYTRSKIKRREEELHRLSMIESERLRIARDMHDDLGGGLSSIRMMSEMAIAQKDPAQIAEISQLSVELVDNMRQIVWALNNENDSVEETCYYLMNYARNYMRPAGIKCVFSKVVKSDRKLNALQRRNLFLVFKEALTNMVRYSGASQLRVDFSMEADRFRMTIADNGRGLKNTKSNGGGNGLKNMRERISQLGGVISFINSDGLTISLEIPIQDNKS